MVSLARAEYDCDMHAVPQCVLSGREALDDSLKPANMPRCYHMENRESGAPDGRSLARFPHRQFTAHPPPPGIVRASA